MDFGLDFIKKLKPCKWKYKAPLNDGKDHFGFIAQDVNEIASKNDYAFCGPEVDGYMTLSYHEFIGPLVKAVQELSDKVIELENKLEEKKK